MSVPAIDGRVDAMPGTGFLMGDKVAPNGFNESFCGAVERELRKKVERKIR